MLFLYIIILYTTSSSYFESKSTTISPVSITNIIPIKAKACPAIPYRPMCIDGKNYWKNGCGDIVDYSGNLKNAKSVKEGRCKDI